jgi:predicted phosphodiesterase
MTKKELIRQYIEDNKLHDEPKRTIARLVVRAHPEVFEQTDNEINRVRRRVTELLPCEKITKQNRRRVERGIDALIPSALKKGSKTYELSQATWIVLNDIHFPYHDEEALKTALMYAKERNVDGILLNGDLCDFYSISTHAKRWDGVDLVGEIEMVQEFFAGLVDQFPNVKIIWKLGNHENRLFRNLNKNAPYIAGLLSMNFGMNMGIEQFFLTEQFGVKVIHDQTIIDANGLLVLHGHEYGIGGVNPSRKMAQELKTSAIQGHLHRSESYNIKNGLGQDIMCATMGCLCNLNADYYGKAKLVWVHGFGMLDVTDSGWAFENKIIIKGKIYGN